MRDGVRGELLRAAPPAGRACPSIVQFLSLGGVGAFWLFARALFEDRPLTPLAVAPLAALSALGLLAMAMPRSDQLGLWIAHNLVEVALAVHVLRVIQRSWRGDLVEARRRARGPFIAIVALYVMTLSVFEVAEDLGLRADWHALAGAASLALLCLGGAVATLQTRAALFGVAAGKSAPTGPDPVARAADRAEIARLSELMATARLWSREGLTIGALAGELGVPEHRLRRLINDELGHRNFAAFVNAHRIDEARSVLADPDQARKTVCSIAYDLGLLAGPVQSGLQGGDRHDPQPVAATGAGAGLAGFRKASPDLKTLNSFRLQQDAGGGRAYRCSIVRSSAGGRPFVAR